MNDPTASVPAQAASLSPNGTEGLQEPSGQPSSQETASPRSLVGSSDEEVAPSNTSNADERNAVCDGCDESTTGTRHKCQDCPNFYYCSRCISDASLIHPGHSFQLAKKRKCLEADFETTNRDDATAPDFAPAESDAKEIVINGQSECRSCAPVAQCLSELGAVVRHKSKLEIISFPWSVRISRLIEATQKGCTFCTLMLDHFFGPSNFSRKPKKQWHPRARKHDKERMLLIKRCMEFLKKLQYGCFGFTVKPLCRRVGSALPDFDALEIRLSDISGREPKDVDEIFSSDELKVDVYAVEGDPAAALISHRVPNPSPGSEDGLAQAKAWLDACVQNHGPSCGAQETSVLPTRVIDVSEPTLRLHEASAGERGNYAALSYCWGGAQTYLCTTHTLPVLLTGFSFDDLPQTLKDAVTVTRSLGLKYLWIDSICIIQNSEADKAHEVGHMARVYSNAHVTIGAGSASAVGRGFLKDKADATTKLWADLLPLRCHILNEKAAAEAKTIKDISGVPRVATGTLYILNEEHVARRWEDWTSRRAWCLQELVISPRFLSYGHWPTWRCRHATLSDGGFYLENPKTGPGLRRLTNTLLRSTPGPSAKYGADLAIMVRLRNAWTTLLRDYTRRDLSLPSDRLPAIGGIAEQLSRRTGVEYIAGLWRSTLLYDVMYCAPPREWLSRPAGNRVPTWSWASVDGPVELGYVKADAEPLAMVHACEATPATGHTAFGEVAGGFMEIEGPFKEVDKDDVVLMFMRQESPLTPLKSEVFSISGAPLPGLGAERSRWRAKMDQTAEKLPGRVFVLLTFARNRRVDYRDRTEETCYTGLVLREVEGGKYERVGNFIDKVDDDWLDHEVEPWEEKMIVII
ncbi:hypothetical protein MAPG_06070 [Magnaporthiopsis poae ATCC 64411]|uniref:ZZ-type domain-containing protein n=1 Tax=Magnaporthiopsis poae (strain ATCC 64411 / 73-15) TaxID=644358 RepID=A0A0C4E127_MAGP6|nr:hypothetical protein MAPG_06070 [Magnaporthiopsis poae ATCC 64411]